MKSCKCCFLQQSNNETTMTRDEVGCFSHVVFACARQSARDQISKSPMESVRPPFICQQGESRGVNVDCRIPFRITLTDIEPSDVTPGRGYTKIEILTRAMVKLSNDRKFLSFDTFKNLLRLSGLCPTSSMQYSCS